MNNRFTVTDRTATTAYTCDDANRLLRVDRVAYTWDNNSNLP